MAKRKYNIGVDVGGTFIKLGIVDEKGTIIARHKIKTQRELGSETIIKSINDNIQILLKASGLDISFILNIGMGFPGTTDSEKGFVVYAPNLFWKDVEVVQAIQREYLVPVFIGQDSRAAAWGEYLVGSGKGYNHIACITLGTGIGCGLIVDRKIYHGGFLSAGEFGHQIVEDKGEKCNCGRHGCLEAYTGGPAIIREANKIPNICSLIDKPANELTVSDVFILADQGNPQAIDIVRSFVKYLGIGLVNLINLNSPELISISGGISNAPDHLLLDPLVKFIRNRAYSIVSDKVKIVKSMLGDDAPLIGAAMLFLNK